MLRVSSFLFVYVRASRLIDILLLYSAIFLFTSLLFKLKYYCMHSSVQDGSIEFLLIFLKDISISIDCFSGADVLDYFGI